jgi:hypothetical protein
MSTLQSVVTRDIFANRPAAGISGRLFFASDTGNSYRDNGTGWDAIATAGSGGGGSAAPNTLAQEGVAMPSTPAAAQLTLGLTYQNKLTVPIMVAVGGNGTGNLTVQTDSNVVPTSTVYQHQNSYASSGSMMAIFFVKPNDYYRLTGISDLATCGRFYQLPNLTASGDLSGSRALSTAYQNTTTNLMVVQVQVTGGAGGFTVTGYSDSSSTPTTVRWLNQAQAGAQTVTLVVMPSHYYKITASSGSLAGWREYQINTPATVSAPTRVTGTQYQNTGTKDILVVLSWTSSNTGSGNITKDGYYDALWAHQGTYALSMLAVIHPNDYYKAFQDSGGEVLNFWFEYVIG